MKKIWRIRKQLMAACLVAVLVLSMIFVPTKKAYAIAGVDDAAFILAMLAAAGVGYVGYSAYNSGNSNLAEDLWGELGDLEDDISDAFDKAVFKVLEGGGGGGNNPDDFDPDNDDPEKKPTTWEKLKQWWKKHPNKALSIGATGSVLNAVSRQFGKSIEEKSLEGRYDFGPAILSDYQKTQFLKNINTYPYYAIVYDKESLEVKQVCMSVSYIICFWDSVAYGTYLVLGDTSVIFYSPSVSPFSSYQNMITDFPAIYSASSNCNLTRYSSRDEALKHKDDVVKYPSSLNPDSTFKTDAAKKAQEDEEKKDKPVYDNVVLPTQEQMTNYANQLQAIAQSDAEPAVKKEQQQKAMNTFVESITNVKEMPNPEPSPDPDPSPDPSPNPDPSPDPDPSPEPDPDAPATDEEAAKYTADLTTVFPFCIPFDLIRAFKVLSVQGEAPVYEMPLQIDYKSIHVDEHWSIDMSDFSSVIQILRVMETLGFIVGLILVTRKLLRG